MESEREYVRDLRFALENYFPLFDRNDQPEALIGQKSLIFANFPEIFNFHSEYVCMMFLRVLLSVGTL